MKLGTTIALCAVSAIGTAIALDKATDGLIRDTISDILIDRGLGMKDDFDDFDDENFDDFEDGPSCSPDCDGDCHMCEVDGLERTMTVLYKGKNTPNVVIVPYSDAVNLYEMIEDAVSRLSESASDIEAFGDKAISFERLYDALEEAGVVGNTKSAEDDSAEPIADDPSVCGHSEENCDAEDPSKLDPDSGNYEITSKGSF